MVVEPIPKPSKQKAHVIAEEVGVEGVSVALEAKKPKQTSMNLRKKSREMAEIRSKRLNDRLAASPFGEPEKEVMSQDGRGVDTTIESTMQPSVVEMVKDVDAIMAGVMEQPYGDGTSDGTKLTSPSVLGTYGGMDLEEEVIQERMDTERDKDDNQRVLKQVVVMDDEEVEEGKNDNDEEVGLTGGILAKDPSKVVEREDKGLVHIPDWDIEAMKHSGLLTADAWGNHSCSVESNGKNPTETRVGFTMQLCRNAAETSQLNGHMVQRVTKSYEAEEKAHKKITRLRKESLKNVEADVDMLTLEDDQLEKKNEGLTQRNAVLSQELDGASKERDDLRRSLTEMKKDYQKLMFESCIMRAERDEANTKASEIVKSLTEERQRWRNIEIEMERLGNENATLTSSLKDMEDEKKTEAGRTDGEMGLAQSCDILCEAGQSAELIKNASLDLNVKFMAGPMLTSIVLEPTL
ncbi:hypothetical protein Dimus_008139 [Dionaea muscipula]